jgi:probable O-glycosylation ligase (exosortase A-associated)
MKQMAFMLVLSFIGIAGSFTLSPVYGVAVYYLFAVLQPPALWKNADEVMGFKVGDFGWSFYVAVAAMIATLLWRSGLYAPMRVTAPPWYGNPRFTRSHYLFLAFTAWISLTFVTAENTTRAWPFFIEYVKIFAMFICATFVLRTVRDLWIIYFTVLAAAVYIGVECNQYYFKSGYLLFDKQGYGGLDNNGGGLMLAMAIPMCFFAWEAVRGWWRWGFLLIIPVLLHAVLLSYSRGAMLSLCVVAPLVFLRTRHKWMVGVVYAGIACSIPVMAGKEIQARFVSIGSSEMDDSAQSRWTTWKIAVRMANERPLLGYGVRNSNLFTHKMGADMEGRSIHSQYLQTAADSGWVALAIYLALIASLILGLREVRRGLRPYRDPETAKVKSIAAGAECALALFCFGAVFLSLEHFEMPYIVMLLGMQLHAITRAAMAWRRPPPAPAAMPVALRPGILAS